MLCSGAWLASARRIPRRNLSLLDRGDWPEAIFRDDIDRRYFLSTLGETCGRTGWRVHAFVLLSNHYHLLVQTPQPNLVTGRRWLQSTWAMRFNRRHGLCGHLLAFGTHRANDPVPPGRHDSTEAERIVRLGLAHYGLEQSQIGSLPRNDPRKQTIARLVRRRTAVGNRWIAQRLAMGHPSAVSRSLQADPALAAQEKELLGKITRSAPPERER